MVLRYLDTAIGFAVIMLLLSLLITTLVQSVIALFNMRGNNLKWGLELLLGQIDPAMPPKVGSEIAHQVLMHPAVASTGHLLRRRRAVAIRVEELFRVLSHLGSREPDDDKGQPSEKQLSKKQLSKKQLRKDALTWLKQLGEPLPEAARIEQLATDIAKVVPVDAAVLRAGMVQVLARPAKVVAGVSDWFDTIMDRTSQRFTMHTRWLSVAAAIVLTFALRLDTPEVLNRIWSNGALRDQLVAAVPEALRSADSVRTYEGRRETLATLVIREVREAEPDTALLTILGRAPSKLGTLEEGADWLAGALNGRSDSATVIAAYRQRMAIETDSLLTRFAHSSKGVRMALADPAIGIFQTPLPPLWSYWWDADHFVRGFISIVLLSLGAPFWYNALKRAANLRPVLAGKVEDETKAKGG